LAAKLATSSIPVVMGALGDPVSVGMLAAADEVIE
jgi:hypothetical protein